MTDLLDVEGNNLHTNLNQDTRLQEMPGDPCIVLYICMCYYHYYYCVFYAATLHEDGSTYCATDEMLKKKKNTYIYIIKNIH